MSESLFDLNIKMHFTERFLIGLVTPYRNQQIKETACFGERNAKHPTLLILNSNINLAEFFYTFLKNMKTKGLNNK